MPKDNENGVQNNLNNSLKTASVLLYRNLIPTLAVIAYPIPSVVAYGISCIKLHMIFVKFLRQPETTTTTKTLFLECCTSLT